MGRYYSGDIEGKFWFGVQSSTAADRFGVHHETPNYVEYFYCEDDLPEVEAEINRIIEGLGNMLQVVEDFFKYNNGYTDDQLSAIGITNNILSEYADLKLGESIRDCIIGAGICKFDAEL
jgi:hypothetical protein